MARSSRDRPVACSGSAWPAISRSSSSRPSSTLACSDNGIVNCLKVTTSSYSAVAGVPVAVLGLVFFAVMLVLQLPPVWLRPEPAVRIGRLAWAVMGLGSVLYLLYAELFLDRRHLPVVHLRARAHAGALRDDRLRDVLVSRTEARRHLNGRTPDEPPDAGRRCVPVGALAAVVTALEPDVRILAVRARRRTRVRSITLTNGDAAAGTNETPRLTSFIPQERLARRARRRRRSSCSRSTCPSSSSALGAH